MKRIIVEGMDNTGKSTLIKHLMSDFHNLELIVNDKGPDQDFDQWWPMVMDTQYHGIVPIHDRFFYSELVYGPHLRGYVKATQGTIEGTAYSLRRDAFLIFCRPPDLAILSNLAERPQMEGVIARATRLMVAYDELMWKEQQHYMQRFVYYDYTASSPKVLSNVVERYLLGEL